MAFMRQNCMKVSDFSEQELKEIEKVMETMVGFRIHETVNSHLRYYGNGYYGVDYEGDTIFYTDPDDFGDESQILSRAEVVSKLGLNFGCPLWQPSEVPNKLYLVKADDGRSYYFSSWEDVLKALKSCELSQHSSIITDAGHIVKNALGMTEEGLMLTNFTIEEV